MKTTHENSYKVLAELRNAGGKISAIGLFRLIAITENIIAPMLVVLHNYTSDKSDNTELADYVMNVGTKYENAKESANKKITDLGTAEIVEIQALCTPATIKGYQHINRKGMTDENYCNAVKIAVPQAIEEMKTVKERPNENVIHLNKVLSYNTNTSNLLIAGELIKGGKSVTITGETKPVAKAPLTVAKEVVKGYLNTRTSKIRTFAITNLNTISINGKKIDLNVG
jgi:hypothetical protein